MLNVLDDGVRHLMRIELKRVVVTISKERSADETWADVVNVEMVDVANVAELGEAFEVVVDVAFGGGIRWGGTESACACDATDDGKMGFSTRMFLEVVERSIYHACEAHHVGGNSCHLFFYIKKRVLIADARAVEV